MWWKFQFKKTSKVYSNWSSQVTIIYNYLRMTKQWWKDTGGLQLLRIYLRFWNRSCLICNNIPWHNNKDCLHAESRRTNAPPFTLLIALLFQGFSQLAGIHDFKQPCVPSDVCRYALKKTTAMQSKCLQLMKNWCGKLGLELTKNH